ncbi:hypothetical protein GO491_05430 [Flavobacteriaceae bacterium Ap0902]|nr:hypothetical protein [Flavobacteriaceae bacterium Ap0902]
MSYSIVGLFRDKVDAAKAELESAGFDADKVDYSPFRSEGEYSENEYEYKEKISRFLGLVIWR